MHQYRGKLIVHTGSMFSGKTSSLWREINRFKIAKYKTAVFKPAVDTRYDKKKIVTHDHHSMEAISIESLIKIQAYVEHHDVEVIGIDEIQFFNDSVQDVILLFEKLLQRDYTIVCAGLDLDYQAKPFELMKELIPRSDYLEKHHAVCSECGNDAWVSFRIDEDESRIKIGSKESYTPLCRKCYYRNMKEKNARKNQIGFLE